MSQFVFLNGDFIPRDEAQVHISDLAIQRGFGIFDFFRTQDGHPFMLQRHLDRFERSASALNLELTFTREEVESFVYRLLELHGFETAGIKLLLTGGDSADGLTPAESNFIMTIQSLSFPDPLHYRQGVKLLTTEYRRDIPSVKTVNYAKVISMRKELQEAGAIDALFVFGGQVYETSRSNFFLVKDGTIRTQSKDVLQGITRGIVIELARENGLELIEEEAKVEWLQEAQEAFISGTTKKVMPVVGIDDRTIGEGKPGPITQKLMDLFDRFEQDYEGMMIHKRM